MQHFLLIVKKIVGTIYSHLIYHADVRLPLVDDEIYHNKIDLQYPF